MNKFLILLKKELRDIITIQTVIPILITAAMFLLMGNFFDSMMETSAPGGETPVESTDGYSPPEGYEGDNIIAFIDLDDGGGTALRDALYGSGYYIVTPASSEIAEAFAADGRFKTLVVVRGGFSEALEGGEKSAVVETYGRVDGFSVMSMVSGSGISSLISSMNRAMSENLISQNLREDSPPLASMQNPIITEEYTVLNGNVQQISPSAVVNFVSMQTMFVPIIILLIITFSSQMLAASVTGERADKTLETLMTVPVRRSHVLMAKILSAAAVSLAYAAVFMASLNSYMSKMSGGMEGESADAIMKSLGVSFDAGTYLVIGLSLFLSVMVGLALAMVIGVLAEDLKKLQGLMMPFMIVLMIPYMMSFLTDISTLPTLARVLLYILPFTHTFTAVNGIFTGRYGLLLAGMLYQLAFLAATVYAATRLFGSDKLFTLKVGGKKKGTGNGRFSKKASQKP